MVCPGSHLHALPDPWLTLQWTTVPKACRSPRDRRTAQAVTSAVTATHSQAR